MKIAIGQINTIPSDFKRNFSLIEEYINRAKAQNTDIIIFPEISLSGYLNQDIIYTPEFVDMNNEYLEKVKRLSNNIAIIIGHISTEKRKGHFNKRDVSSLIFGGRYIYFNSASVFFNNKRIFLYYKQRLPSFDIFNEERYFGIKKTAPFFKYNGFKIGLNICEDIWYDNGPYEDSVEAGADIIINLSASPFYIGKPEIRYQLIKNKVKRSRVFTIYANCVGGQDDLIYDGNSFVFNRFGRLISKGAAFQEELIITDTDSDEDIKPVFIKEEMFIRGITLGIKDYFEKNGIKRAIVGLSGGIDSALVSTLCNFALGSKNIINTFLPSKFTSDESKVLVKEFIKRQKTELITIPIKNTYSVLLNELRDIYQGHSSLPFENLQSRIRGTILMFISNAMDGTVIATGNKNEIALGYNTLYGDTVGAIAPIGDLYKNEVIELCNYINKNYNSIIPDEIINRIPSAELRRNQRDEDDLPPYSITNRLLPEMIEQNRTDNELVRMGFDKEIINFVHRAIKRSEFKRRQMPFILKLKPKSFGLGRRIPITHNFPFTR